MIQPHHFKIFLSMFTRSKFAVFQSIWGHGFEWKFNVRFFFLHVGGSRGRGREGCFAHCVTILANQNSPTNNITGITANPTRASLINVLANSVLVYMSTCINRLFYFRRDGGSFRLSQTRLFKLKIFGSRSGKSSIWPNLRFLFTDKTSLMMIH